MGVPVGTGKAGRRCTRRRLGLDDAGSSISVRSLARRAGKTGCEVEIDDVRRSTVLADARGGVLRAAAALAGCAGSVWAMSCLARLGLGLRDTAATQTRTLTTQDESNVYSTVVEQCASTGRRTTD